MKFSNSFQQAYIHKLTIICLNYEACWPECNGIRTHDLLSYQTITLPLSYAPTLLKIFNLKKKDFIIN